MMQKRKREARTDYRARLKMLGSGKLRLVARISSKNILMQIVKYEISGDIVLVSAHSNELKKYNWNYSKSNICSAYLVGLLIAIKAKKKNINEVIFDCGLRRAVKGGVLFATLKGAVDGGLDIPHNEEAFPADDRISGKHIAEYAKSLPREEYSKIFSKYLKSNAKPEEIQKHFLAAKENILRG